MTRHEMAELVADVVTEHFERLRGDLFARMLELRTPKFAITPKGELYVDGELVGDLRPVFAKAVEDALASAAQPESVDDSPG